MMTRIGAERGWPPVTRAQFEREAGPDGALCVGSPETVARKIAATVKALKLSRFDMKYSNGALPHEKLLTSIELYGTQVVPLVRESLEDGQVLGSRFWVLGSRRARAFARVGAGAGFARVGTADGRRQTADGRRKSLRDEVAPTEPRARPWFFLRGRMAAPTEAPKGRGLLPPTRA